MFISCFGHFSCDAEPVAEPLQSRQGLAGEMSENRHVELAADDETAIGQRKNPAGTDEPCALVETGSRERLSAGYPDSCPRFAGVDALVP